MSHTPNTGRYDALTRDPPSGYHGQQSTTSLPMEDLDFDLPPHGGLPAGAGRPAFYQNPFGGPELRGSYAESAASSTAHLPSHNPSEAALPGGRDSSYHPSRLGASSFQPYYDNPSQVGITHDDYPMASMNEKRHMYDRAGKRSKKPWLIGGIISLLLIAVGVAAGVYFGIVRPNQHKKSGDLAGDAQGSNNSSGSGKPSGSQNLVVTGSDGSQITTEDGTSFTYKNPYEGVWYSDPNQPFNNNAQAQSWTPPLNQSWRWGVDKIYGVNIGGWLNTEPFISPALYEKYANNPTPPVDEWTLSLAMAQDTAGGGLNQLEEHYKTFITEEDFASIAGAGLNWVRIPFPYWGIEVREGEPFLEGVAWKYFLKAIEWARKYGLRINLDFHALPGSQNGWNHSGRLGSINMLNGVMGLANAQRSLTYIRILAEFISQPQYKDVICMFGITNEPQASVIGNDQLSAYYYQAYQIVREASGIGEGKGPMISFHDGFRSLQDWAPFLRGADRISLDTHPYFAFGDPSANPVSTYPPLACTTWGPMMNDSWTNFGPTAAGEFSLATNDCGLFVNGVGLGTRYEGTFNGGTGPGVGNCSQWDDWESWTPDIKAQLKQFAMSSMDALGNWFFWTWKIGNSTTFNEVRAPFWSYQLGLQQGWIPADPRTASGSCQQTDPYVGPPQPWQTGGAGAGQIDPTATAALPWPPADISNAGPASLLPSYTPTGAIPTLAAPTFTPADKSVKIDAGNGWNNPQDTGGAYVPIPECTYFDPWGGVGVPLPTAPCGGGAAPTPAPAPAPAPVASTGVTRRRITTPTKFSPRS